MKRKIFILLASLLPSLIAVVQPAMVAAEIQIEVSGNGSDTQNSVNVDSSQNTTVNQENTADVSNDVSQEANSGGNSISDTTGGDSTITTGSVTENTSVVNDLNNSEVALACCNDNSINITVAGNGSNSVNTVNTQVAGNTVINVTQVANVNNDIKIIGNSGENTISGTTGGNSLIDTGNVKAGGKLENILNHAEIRVGQGAWDITIINKDNGDDSVNVIYLDFVDNLYINRLNLADVNNNIYADLNTGRNNILDTLGDATIRTGDVEFAFNVTNGPINTGSTQVICCEDGEVPDGGDGDGDGGPLPSPSPGVPPPTISGNGEHKDEDGDGDGGGDVLVALTDILPATGASAFHFWILAVVYLLTFLSGLYMRLRAGRSPDSRPRSRFQGYALLTY